MPIEEASTISEGPSRPGSPQVGEALVPTTGSFPTSVRSPRSERARHLSRGKLRRRLQRRRLAVLVGVVVAVPAIGWLAIPSGSGLPRLGSTPRPGTSAPRPVYLPALVPLVSRLTTFSGAPARLPIPGTGQSAVYVRDVGLLGASADERSVPMGSVTKVMTAILVLRDHPLGAGSGPTFTMTAADHVAWVDDESSDDSNLEVVAGERLTERQLLEALMIPSADNIADYLARWDAGSIVAFVRKMNVMARRLGLKSTHYADASGLSPDSRSTAVDQAILGAYAMTVPGMIGVEDHPTMSFPVEGIVANYNPVVGQDGVIGLKSGFTSAAQACLVTAARRSVGGHSVLVISSTLGQPMSLPEAGQIDLQLLDAATSALEARPILRTGQPVAAVVAGWTKQRPAVVVATDPETVVGWPGLRVTTVIRASIPAVRATHGGWELGDTMATVEVSTPGGVQITSPAMLVRSFPAAPAGWSPSSAAGLTTASAGRS